MPRLAPALLAASCAAVFVACGGSKKDDKPAAVEQKPAAKKAYTRDEFRKLVLNKTADEVIKAVGKPDSTSELGDSVWWYYKNVTTDPITGKTDQSVQLAFSGGVVASVNY